MNDILSSVRWGWAIAAAVLAQAVLIPLVYTIGAFTSGWDLTHFDLLITRGAYVLVPFLAGVWVARKASGHFTANGLAVGLLTALAFLPVLIIAPPPYPLMEAVNGGLKILGGLLGGGLVGHRKRRRARKQRRA